MAESRAGGRRVEPAGDGATGEGKQAPINDRPDPEGELLLYAFEDQADLLTGRLIAAADECRTRAAAERQSIKARFTGRRRRDELEAARRRAEQELRVTLAALRRDCGNLRGTKRGRRRGSLGLA